jgi:hypothetical protein
MRCQIPVAIESVVGDGKRLAEPCSGENIMESRPRRPWAGSHVEIELYL